MDEIYFYIDESFDKTNRVLRLCLIVVSKDENTEIRNSLLKLKDELSNDQYLGIRNKNIQKLFHFTDDKHEVRNKLIDYLRTSHFKGYIAYKKISDSYQETYRYLFYKLLKDRINKYSEQYIRIYYEENSNISPQTLDTQIKDIQTELKKTCINPSFYNIECKMDTKENIMLGIPDYALGVLNGYLDKNNQNEHSRLSFEKLRGKIRLIMDLDTNQFFTRNNII